MCSMPASQIKELTKKGSPKVGESGSPKEAAVSLA